MEAGMALRHVILVIPFVFSAAALAADSEDRAYPQDDAPACMERDANGAAVRCVLRGSRIWEQKIAPHVDDEPAAGPPATLPSEPPEFSIAIAN
jgi:hypothetical protein